MAEEIDKAISGSENKDRDSTTLRLIEKTQQARK